MASALWCADDNCMRISRLARRTPHCIYMFILAPIERIKCSRNNYVTLEPAADSCGHSNEAWVSTNGGEFLD
jgi:hypothetical protein